MNRCFPVVTVAHDLLDSSPIACTWDILPRILTCSRGWNELWRSPGGNSG